MLLTEGSAQPSSRDLICTNTYICVCVIGTHWCPSNKSSMAMQRPGCSQPPASAWLWPWQPTLSLPCTGYSSPLKEIPHEKFNVTAIPKGYRSPWQELFGDRNAAVYGKNPPPMRPPAWDFKSFNR